ncbi:hypothetical protein [Umezawaea sp. Da 62-37]|uniref:hypothetical protein n=1 Tax=Umezawaea sp. Da 62-37 TaxID=3075927 RepID=UPI0028F7205C|nr:hypothetical protein [Umezawaea sp. Da 62-37]WNV87617.1 hypothetical protein RM788_04745 [Umezawaea sp. Da 62-37]
MTTTMLPTCDQQHEIQHDRRRLPNFCPTDATWSATATRDAIDASLRTEKPTAFELSHVDVQRYGDTPAGRRRARAAALLVLALPGTLHFHEADRWELFGEAEGTRPPTGRLGSGQPTPDGTSLARLCRSALVIRRSVGSAVVEWLPSPPGTLSFRRPGSTTGINLTCTLNMGIEVVAVPRVGSPALASSYYGLRDNDLLLPPDTVVWSIRRHAG